MTTRGYSWEVMQRIAESRAILIVRAANRQLGLDQCRRLTAAGADVIEVSFTTPDAAQLISDLVATSGPNQIIGAGTVLDATTARRAIDAGAQFLLAPGLAPEMISTGKRHGVAVIPAAQTASEAMVAMELGAPAVKLFPASTIGINGMAAIAEALPHIPFVPTGGVDLGQAQQWIDAGAVAVGLGGAAARADLAELSAVIARLGRDSHSTVAS